MKEQATVYRAGCPVRVADGRPCHIDSGAAPADLKPTDFRKAPWAQRKIS